MKSFRSGLGGRTGNASLPDAEIKTALELRESLEQLALLLIQGLQRS